MEAGAGADKRGALAQPGLCMILFLGRHTPASSHREPAPSNRGVRGPGPDNWPDEVESQALQECEGPEKGGFFGQGGKMR